MENASKALLMAGGILIAILIIGALLLMVNRIGDYQRGQASSVKDSQLAKFNLDFERYFDDKGILGTDLISLANKVIDYNDRGDQLGVKNSSVNYDIKMTLNLDMTGFKQKYGNGDNSMFSSNNPRYTIDANNRKNSLRNMMNLYNEQNFTVADIALLKKLSSIYDTSKNKTKNIEDIRNELKYINKSYESIDFFFISY